jgi:hypothetical protein
MIGALNGGEFYLVVINRKNSLKMNVRSYVMAYIHACMVCSLSFADRLCITFMYLQVVSDS